MDSILTRELTVGNYTFPNRVMIQPMEGCDGTGEGGISDLTRRRYMRFAESGVSLIWFEACSVCREGRSNPRQLFLCDETKESFKVLLDDMRARCKELYGYAPIIVLQLNHSGRQSRPVDVPRAIYGNQNDYLDKMKPITKDAVFATEEYLDTLPSKFVASAKLALEVGFDGVDVKCCHGYLFNEMMAAYNRDDKYGGKSIDNRARLYLDSFKAVKEAVGDDMLVTSRFGAYDGFEYPYGFGVNENNEEDLSEAFYVIEKLEAMGLDLLNITIGNPYVNPHVNRPYKVQSPEDGKIGVARIKRITKAIAERFPNIAIIESGMTFAGGNAMVEAEEDLNNGVAKMVGFGRMAFAYPEFYQDYVKTGSIDPKKVCICCGNCSKMMRAGGVAGCPVRDTAFFMPIFKELMAKK